jgi:hypothetical protein
VIPEFATLDEAVRASFPQDSCRIVAIHERGDAAIALLDTRPSAEPYLYEVHYQRANGRWSEGSSSNGAGWQRLKPDSDLGVVTAWGEAPAGADQVRAALEGHVLEEAVASGVYFVVWWDVPASDPQVSAFRVNGEWVRAPTMSELFQAQRATWLRSRGS